MSEIVISLEQAIAEDGRKVSLWKRDTEAIIELLNRRKEELPYGSWGAYLEGIGMAKSTAHRLMSPKKPKENTKDVPNGTFEDAEVVEDETSEWDNYFEINLNIPDTIIAVVEDRKLRLVGSREDLTEYKQKLGRAKLFKQ